MIHFTLLILALQTDPATMPADSWLAAPNTKMGAVIPANGQFPGTWGVVGPASVIIAWGGGALDTKRSRLILFGGGHADYGGNELYGFTVGTMTWERMTDPTVNPADDGSDLNPDGTPQSRHSYGGLAYLAHADRFFALGGSVYRSGGGACRKVWTYDLAGKAWARDAAEPPFSAGYDASCAYDPVTKKLWFCQVDGGSWAHVWGYDSDAKTWTALPIGTDLAYGAAAIDTKRGLLVVTTGGTVKAYDVRGNAPAETWATTGGGDFVGVGHAGFDYDPVSDKLVGWVSDKVFILDPVTKVWDVRQPAGAPAPSSNGTYGRWRYVPSVNAFILVTGLDVDVHFYKMPGAGAPPAQPPAPQPPPPSSPPPSGTPSSDDPRKGMGHCGATQLCGATGFEPLFLVALLALTRKC